MGETSLQERVARAICAGLRRDPDHTAAGYVGGLSDAEIALRQRPQWMAYAHVADAAIDEFADFLHQRSTRKQARALDVEQTIAEMSATKDPA